MAYSDSIGDNAQLLARTLKGVTEFDGRSRRTEVIYYWIAGGLLGVVLNFAASTIMPFQTSMVFGDCLQLALSIPTFALFVRRLHDQNRSGWWGILRPLAFALSIPNIRADLSGDVREIAAQTQSPVTMLVGLCGLAIFVLFLLPGTDGPNSYRSDSRLEEPDGGFGT